MNPTERRDLLLLVVMCAFWAAAFFLLKDLQKTFTDTGIGFVRFGIVSSGLWGLYAVPKFRRGLNMNLPSRPMDRLWGLSLGIFLNGPAYLVYYWGMKYTGGALANLMASSSPVLLAGAGYLILRERMRGLQWFGLLVGLVGMYVVVAGKWGMVDFHTANTHGLLLIGVAMTLETLGTVFAKPLVQRYSGMGAIILTMTGNTIFFVVAGLALRNPITVGPVTTTDMWMVAYLSLFCGLMLFPAWYWIMERLPIGLMAITLFVQAPAAALIGWIWYSDKLPVTAWQGAVLIFVSLWLCTAHLRPRRAPAREEEAALVGAEEA